MDNVDRIGRRATAALVDDVHRRVDSEVVDAALRRARQDVPITVVRVTATSPRRQWSRRWWVPVVAVGAVAVAVVAAVVLGRDDTSHRLGPAATEPTVSSVAPPTTGSPQSTTTIEPVEPVQRAVVRLDASTPTLDGALVAAVPLANTHPWDVAVSPSGRVLMAQMVDGATYSEVVDGRLVDTGIPFVGDLTAGLDERVFNRHDQDTSLDQWSQQDDGTWVVSPVAPTTGGPCEVVGRPDVLPCGDSQVLMDQPAGTSYYSWNDAMQLTLGIVGEDAMTWQVELDSDDERLDGCADGDCQLGWRAGREGFVLTPAVGLDVRPGARFVSLLRPGTDPATAWLDCGRQCVIVGSTLDSVFTFGYANDVEDGPAAVVRRFDFDDIAALQSTIDPATVDALAPFAAAPLHAPDLADVPTLLPSVVPAGGVPTRWEYADAPAEQHDFVQTWARPADHPMVVRISTELQQGPSYDGDLVEVSPWDRSLFAPMADGYAQLVLTDPSGMVVIWAQGLTREDLLVIARSLRLRADGVGWDADLPEGLVSIHEGWALGAAMRSLRWGETAEMHVAHGLPDQFVRGAFESTIDVVDVAGVPAMVVVDDFGDSERVAVVWSPAPDVTVLVGLIGTRADALAVARSVASVDRATWEAASVVDTSNGDGCTSMFC
jgi:hypothetical protein